MKWKHAICSLNLSPSASAVSRTRSSGATQKRLEDAFSSLETIDSQRAKGADPLLGKYLEQRLIWRELLELELQEIDEQLERIYPPVGDRSA